MGDHLPTDWRVVMAPNLRSIVRVAKRTPAAQVVRGPYRAARDVVRRTREGVQIVTSSGLRDAYSEGGAKKSVAQQIVDNATWAVRRKGPNKFYYAFGMDSKHGRDPSQYLSVWQMMNIISKQIEEDGTKHAESVLKDKYFFSLIAQSLGHPSPRVLALLDPSGVVRLDPRQTMTFEEFVDEGDAVDGFAKLSGGEKGRGAFALKTEDGQVWVDGEPTDAAGLARRVDARFLLQERIVQHEALAALHAPSVNTVRLVTVLANGTVTPLVAALRVGVGGVPVDNWSAGGLVVGLDLDTGRLRGRGVFKPGCGGETRYGGFVDRHPGSGIELDGYALPMVPEAVELARQFHLDMGGPRTIGWDLAMTPEGPWVVEGNSHWSGAMYMAIDPNFKDDYFRAIELQNSEY